MNNWQRKKLGDIGRIAMCKRIMKDQTSAHGDIPFYKIGTFGKDPDAYIPSELYENYKSKYSFPKIGEILISASGTIGRAVVYDGSPAYFQDSNIVWLAHDESVVLNKFLGYAYTRINWQTDSGTIARLYNDNFRRVTIKVPEKPEQERIVGVLEVWDEYIEKLEQKIALKEQLKKGLMQQYFTVNSSDRGVAELQDYVKSFSTGLNPRKNFVLGRGSNRYITIKNISDGRLNIKNAEFVDDAALSLIAKRSKLAKYDVIMSSIGNVGEAYLLKSDPEGWNINESVFSLKPDPSKVLPEYLYYLVTSEFAKRFFDNHVTGSSFKSIKMKDLKAMPVKDVSIDEQNEIAKVLVNIDSQLNNLRQQKENLINQKRYLLKNLITGTIRTPEDLQPLDTSRLERSAL